MYTPLAENVRKVIVIPEHGKPHNHPSYPLNKHTFTSTTVYNKALNAIGTFGATVSTVDNGERLDSEVFLLNLYI